jgi:heptaprenyl diphosphate synthase
MKKNSDPVILAFFTALAVTIYVLENLIPKPSPFMKLGLANIVVLLLLYRGSTLAAFVVLMSKTLLGGLVSGLLFSPVTVISGVASVTAFIVMQIFIASKIDFSIIGLSVAGAVSHNLMQIVVVNMVLIMSNAVYRLLPLMIVMGIVTGMITGYLASLLNSDSVMGRYFGENEVE